MESNIIAGLVSGLIVTLLVVVFGELWKKSIIPWIEDLIYKDIRIEGKWFTLYPATLIQRQEIVILKRHGHTIDGTMTCIKGEDEGEQYKLFGSFRNLILPLTYESIDLSKSDRGTITLKCIMNGERLSGKIAAYSSDNEDIDTGTVLWFKSKKDLEKTIAKVKSQQEKIKQLNKERKRISKEEAEIENIENEDLTKNESTNHSQ